MSMIAVDTRPTWLVLHAARLALLGGATFALGACGPSAAPAVYVLGAAPAAVVAATPQVGLPVVEVKSVGLPDYLDNTDLLVRHGGGQVVASQAGRWGERLSAGFTRALAAALAARLPDMAVIVTPPVGRPVRQVLVDVESFEARGDGEVVLVARWSVMDGSAREILVSERVSLVEPVTSSSDAAVVTAMTRVTEQLAGRIATRLQRASAVARGRR